MSLQFIYSLAVLRAWLDVCSAGRIMYLMQHNHARTNDFLIVMKIARSCVRYTLLLFMAYYCWHCAMCLHLNTAFRVFGIGCYCGHLAKTSHSVSPLFFYTLQQDCLLAIVSPTSPQGQYVDVRSWQMCASSLLQTGPNAKHGLKFGILKLLMLQL